MKKGKPITPSLTLEEIKIILSALIKEETDTADFISTWDDRDKSDKLAEYVAEDKARLPILRNLISRFFEARHVLEDRDCSV